MPQPKCLRHLLMCFAQTKLQSWLKVCNMVSLGLKLNANYYSILSACPNDQLKCSECIKFSISTIYCLSNNLLQLACKSQTKLSNASESPEGRRMMNRQKCRTPHYRAPAECDQTAAPLADQRRFLQSQTRNISTSRQLQYWQCNYNGGLQTRAWL